MTEQVKQQIRLDAKKAYIALKPFLKPKKNGRRGKRVNNQKA